MSVTNMTDDRPFLKIVFDGVVAVGPGRPPEGEVRNGPFFGVMARSTRRLSDRTQRLRREKEAAVAVGASTSNSPEEDPYYVHMHVPTIFTRLKPAEGSRPPDQIMQHSPFHERWYLWHPLRERLEFRINGDGTPGPLDYPEGERLTFSSRHGNYLHENELSFRGIEHVPHLSEIFPDRSVLRDGLLSQDPEVDQRVLTQVLVPRGTVVAAGVLERGTPRKVVFEPVQNRDQQDALPNAAVIVRGTNVKIASYSLDSGEPLDSIKIDAPEGGEIWVSNGDPSDVEIDMERLAIQIMKRLLGNKSPQDIAAHFEPLARRFGRELDAEFVMQFMKLHHHHGDDLLRDLARVRHRTGDFDLDFELFYTLMKDKSRSPKNVGLPVPKHVDADRERGPDCYACVCSTNDRLELRSNSNR